jgi:hypothetical protein
MNRFPLEQRHVDQAKDLYTLRSHLLARHMTSIHSVMDLERRLAVHLSVLAQLAKADFSATGKDAERFLYFATKLQTDDRERLLDTCVAALEQVLEGNLNEQPVYDAFALYPPPTDLLFELYKKMPKSGLFLFKYWRQQRTELPPSLVNQAELQNEDPSLQREALFYAANRPAYGNEIFRAYYQPFLNSITYISLPEAVWEPALWGGLVRGDAGAELALRRAVELASSTEVRMRLLRLMALNGSPDHQPVLLEAFERTPQFDTRWWALTGHSASASHLIEALGQPERADSAHDDWHFLTGTFLPKRPALMLVNEQGKTVEPDSEHKGEVKMVPDSHFAQAWWEAHQASWAQQRWVMGQPDDIDWLYRLCRDYTGRLLDDLMDLLALKLQRPIAARSYSGWQFLRLQELQQSADKHPTSSPSVALSV